MDRHFLKEALGETLTFAITALARQQVHAADLCALLYPNEIERRFGDGNWLRLAV